MKKLFSSILALTMMLSLFTFTTVHAGTDGYYKVSYEAIGDADINNLKVDDMFFAVVTLKDAEGLFSNQLSFTWNPEVLQLSNSSGAASTNFIQTTTSRYHQSVKVNSFDDENTGEYQSVNAYEAETGVTNSSLKYYFSPITIKEEDGSTHIDDLLLSGDVTIIKVRFKVLKAEDPNFTFTNYGLVEVKADGATLVPRTASSFDTLSFAGSTSTTETKTFAATITSSAKPLAADTLRFLFDVTEDGVVKVKGYDLALGVDFDTNATINAALQVKDIDTSKVTSFAFKSVEWK